MHRIFDLNSRFSQESPFLQTLVYLAEWHWILELGKTVDLVLICVRIDTLA